MLNTTLADAKEENSRLGWESFPLLVESLEDEEEEHDAQHAALILDRAQQVAAAGLSAPDVVDVSGLGAAGRAGAAR